MSGNNKSVVTRDLRVQSMPGKIQSFLEVALKDFSHVGGIFPSSPWASRAVVRHLPESLKKVVEYGPGNGTLTEHILGQMPSYAKLYGIEVNLDFVHELQKFNDPRLEVRHQDVIQMSGRLRELSAGGVDAVISGIPFSFLTLEDKRNVVENTRDGIRHGGRFIVYQNSSRMKHLLHEVFGNVEVFFEPRNIFPYFIMVATRVD